MEATIIDGLDPETEEKVIDQVAEQVLKRGLQVPVVIALESHKPIGPVLAQMAVAFSPFLVPFLGFENVNKYGALLAKRETIEKLIQRIEDGARAPALETQ
jgi:hypothetical protein